MMPEPRPRMKIFRERKTRRRWVANSTVAIGLLVALCAALAILPADTFNDLLSASSPRAVAPGEPENFPLRLSEVMSSNRKAYPDDRGNFPDWIEVENISDASINLEGIGLSDRDTAVKFIFPSYELGPREYAVVFCDDTHSSDADTLLHGALKLSANGESVYLFDRNAVLLDKVTVPALMADTSFAYMADEWMTTEQYTPGFPNSEEGYARFLSQTLAPPTGLMINELSPANHSMIRDEDGDFSDWIELYNGSDLPIDLSNYMLTNNPAKLSKWRFPKGATIEPGGYYLVFASGKNTSGNAETPPHASFRLSRGGATVVLSDIYAKAIDRVTYGEIEEDTSWGRVEGLADTWETCSQPTPGLPNDLTGASEMDRRVRAQNTSGLYITEIMASSRGVDTAYGNTSYDWIEIHNAGSESINLRGYGLSDKAGRPRKWQFPERILGPGEYLPVFASGLGQSPTDSGALHTTFRLSAGGEPITLSDPQGNILDRMAVPRLQTGWSYGRGTSLDGLYYYDAPTPGEANIQQGYSGYASQPAISQRGGIFTKPVTVTLTAPEGVRIRYTLDGSEPLENIGFDYEDPITISKSSVLRARGFANGLRPSEVATESFLVNVYHILPVVSLTVDPDDLWNPLTGIYADGFDETFEKVPFRNATYYKMNKDKEMRERGGNFELMSPEGEQLVNESVAVQLHGNFSLDIAQKSFRVTAKPKYGSEALNYPFFADRPYESYRAVILRNGGNDGSYSRIVDSLIHKIVDWTETDLIHMASTPCIVYLNGQYWGQYDIRERLNKYYAAMYEGWDDPRNMDYIKGDNNVLNGSFSDYRSLLDYVKKNDLNGEEALTRVLDWIDVDNYFDFMIFQTFFGNTDTMNIKFYRERREGAKWRWVFFDIDWGYFNRSTNGFSAWLKDAGTGDKLGDNTLIKALLKVPSMRDKFLTRYGELFQEYFTDTDRILAEIDQMVAGIDPEMKLHFTRWAGETSPAVAIDPYNARENAYAYWMGRVNRLKNTATARPYHVWIQAQEWFKLSNEEMIGYFGPCPEEGENRF